MLLNVEKRTYNIFLDTSVDCRFINDEYLITEHSIVDSQSSHDRDTSNQQQIEQSPGTDVQSESDNCDTPPLLEEDIIMEVDERIDSPIIIDLTQ